MPMILCGSIAVSQIWQCEQKELNIPCPDNGYLGHFVGLFTFRIQLVWLWNSGKEERQRAFIKRCRPVMRKHHLVSMSDELEG